MELKEILAISGQPGLYKFVAQSVRGVIVESLLDGRRMNASANAKVSALSEISMFTEGEDIALADCILIAGANPACSLAFIRKSSGAPSTIQVTVCSLPHCRCT